MQMKKKLLIFDVDGTVWDSGPDILFSFNHILQTHYQFKIGREDFGKLAGMPLQKMFMNTVANLETERAQFLAKEYRKHYIDAGNYINQTVLYPDVLETLGRLKEAGFLLAIASSKPIRVLTKMVDHFKLPKFDSILGTGESQLKDKPNPDIILETMAKLKVATEDAVMIGDSSADILAGNNAGTSTIAVSYGFDDLTNLLACNPMLVIDRFSELSSILINTE